MDSYNDFQRFKDKTGTDSIDFKEMSVSKQQPDLRNNSILEQLSQSRQPDTLSGHINHVFFTTPDTVNQFPANTILNSYNDIVRRDTTNPFTPIHHASEKSDDRMSPLFQEVDSPNGDVFRDDVKENDTVDLDKLERFSSSIDINNTENERETSLQDVLRRIALCR